MTIQKKIIIEYNLNGDYPKELEESIVLCCFSSGEKMITSDDYIVQNVHNEDMINYKNEDFNFFCRITSVSYEQV